MVPPYAGGESFDLLDCEVGVHRVQGARGGGGPVHDAVTGYAGGCPQEVGEGGKRDRVAGEGPDGSPGCNRVAEVQRGERDVARMRERDHFCTVPGRCYECRGGYAECCIGVLIRRIFCHVQKIIACVVLHDRLP